VRVCNIQYMLAAGLTLDDISALACTDRGVRWR
jgi:hypothetical protein